MPDDTLTPLMNSLRNLKSLVIINSPCLNDAGLAAITATMTRRRSLTRLDVSGCKFFSNEALLVMLQAGGGVLQDINISNCTQIRDLGLMGLSARSHRTCLRTLRMTGLLKTTSSGMAFLAEGIGRTQKEQQELRHSQYLEKLKSLKKEAMKDKDAVSPHLETSIISTSSLLKSSSVIKYGKPVEESGKKGTHGTDGSEASTAEFYAAFSYGNSTKSKARRAEARKGKQFHKPKRFGIDELFIDSWISLLDAGLSKLGTCGALAQLLVISITKCVEITSVGVNFVLRGAPLLQKANFSGCHQVDDDIAIPFTFPLPMTNLERRRRHEAEVAKGFDADGGGDGEDNNGDEELCSCRFTLVELQLSGLPKISDRSLAIIAAACPRLTSFIVSSDLNALNVTRSTKVSHAAHEFLFSIACRKNLIPNKNDSGGKGSRGSTPGTPGSPKSPKSPHQLSPKRSFFKRSSSNISNSGVGSTIDGNIIDNNNVNLSASLSLNNITGSQSSFLLNNNSNSIDANGNVSGGGGLVPLVIEWPSLSSVSIGRLVTLDLSGAPRIDDDALMILFGGGSYSQRVDKPESYQINKTLYNDALKEEQQEQQREESHINTNSDDINQLGDYIGNSVESSSAFNTRNNQLGSMISSGGHHQLPKSKEETQRERYGYGGGTMALKHLKIKWCNSLSDVGMAAALDMAGKHSKQGLLLETFDAQGCPRLGDRTAIALAKLMQQQFRAGLGSSSLKFLSLSGWAYLSDLGVCLLLQSLSRYDETPPPPPPSLHISPPMSGGGGGGDAIVAAFPSLHQYELSQTSSQASSSSSSSSSINKKNLDSHYNKYESMNIMNDVDEDDGGNTFVNTEEGESEVGGGNLWETLEYASSEVCNLSESMRLDAAIAQKKLWLLDYLKKDAIKDELLYDYQILHKDNACLINNNYSMNKNNGDSLTDIDDHGTPMNPNNTDIKTNEHYEQTPLLSTSVLSNRHSYDDNNEDKKDENVCPFPFQSSSSSSSSSSVAYAPISLIKYEGYPELSVLEDEEDLWNDWANSNLLKDRIRRESGGGVEPIIIDIEKQAKEEKEQEREKTEQEKELDMKKKKAYELEQELIKELHKEPRINQYYREVFKMNSNKQLSPVPLYSYSSSRKRVRKGRGFGLHGRFTTDSKPIPWFFLLNGWLKTSMLSRLRCRLKHFEITGCDWVGDTSIQILAKTCAATITHLDIKGLDELSELSSFYLAQCKRLNHIDFRSTGISDSACRLLANRLPLGQQNYAERRIEPRPEACANFNSYALERRFLHSAAVRIQMDARRWLSTMLVQREFEDQLWASPHCQRLARGFLGRIKSKTRANAGMMIRRGYQVAMIRHFARVARKKAIAKAHQARLASVMATMVQCFVRRHAARARMARKKKRMVRILQNWENITANICALRLNQSVTSMVIKSQRIFRAARQTKNAKRYELSSRQIQRIWRGFKGRHRYAIVREAKFRMLNAASVFVQRNHRRRVFWRHMHVCAIRRRERAELHYKMSCRIQRWWAAMLMRLRFLRTVKERKTEKAAAIKIQALFRGHILRYNKACRKVKIIGHWGFFYHYIYHIKYKSEKASMIQRLYRAHIRVRVENRAAVNIQRVFRGFEARKLKAILIFQRYDRCSRILQRMFRVWRARQIRKLVVATREAAAPVIQRCFRAWRFREYLRRMRARTQIARAQALEASKGQMELEKHRNLLEKMVNRGKEMAAMKIQRQYRAHRARKNREAQERIKAEAEMRQLMARQERIDRMNDRKKAAKTMEGKTKKLVQNIGDRFTVKPNQIDVKKKMAEAKEKAGDFVGKAVKGAFTGRKHPKETQERNLMLEGAIMNHHTRTSVMQGIVEIHITVGSLDTANFQERNDERKLNKQPVWDRIDKDLSGPNKKFVYLWYLRGEGRTVFTGMQVVLAPEVEERTNAKKVEARLSSLRRSGTVVAGHPSLSFEIQGLNTRTSGGSAPAVDEIAISMSPELDLSLRSKGYDRLNPGFYKFDCGVKRQPIHLWIHVKRFKFERKANDMAKSVLSEFEWWTNGVGDCVDKFGISVDAIVDIHNKCFKALDFNEEVEENDIEVCEWLDALGEARSKYFIYLLTCTGCTDTDQINFTRYLNTVATFCMFSKEELMRFLFGFCIKTEKVASYALFEEMVAGILEFESSVFPPHKVAQAWKQFSTRRGDMFWENFRTMLLSTPVLIWPIQRLQVKLAKQNLGEQFWMSQKQAMINARSRLGIRRDLS